MDDELVKSPRHCFAKTRIIDILFSLSHSDVGILYSLSNGVEQSVIGFWIIEIFTWGIYSCDPQSRNESLSRAARSGRLYGCLLYTSDAADE